MSYVIAILLVMIILQLGDIKKLLIKQNLIRDSRGRFKKAK